MSDKQARSPRRVKTEVVHCYHAFADGLPEWLKTILPNRIIQWIEPEGHRTEIEIWHNTGDNIEVKRKDFTWRRF